MISPSVLAKMTPRGSHAAMTVRPRIRVVKKYEVEPILTTPLE
ncbi:hypothetical protein [Arthrobacter sp. AQ5-05]|nr:hypothetical protein [Arthrobacter sp. AQ5-05]